MEEERWSPLAKTKVIHSVYKGKEKRWPPLAEPKAIRFKFKEGETQPVSGWEGQEEWNDLVRGIALQQQGQWMEFWKQYEAEEAEISDSLEEEEWYSQSSWDEKEAEKYARKLEELERMESKRGRVNILSVPRAVRGFSLRAR